MLLRCYESAQANPPGAGLYSNLQEAVPCLTGEGVGTQSSTWTVVHYMIHGQLAFTPQALTAGYKCTVDPQLSDPLEIL